MNMFLEWMDRINSGVFTKTQCRQFASAIVPISVGDKPGGWRTNITPEQAQSLCDTLILRRGVGLTPAHILAGANWLRSQGRRNGLPDEMIDGFHHFSYHGEAKNLLKTSHSRGFYIPMYRIHTTTDKTFWYAKASWQSGGGCWWYPNGARDKENA